MSTCLLSRLQFEWLVSVALEYMTSCCVGVYTPTVPPHTHTKKTPSFVIRILVGYRTHRRHGKWSRMSLNTIQLSQSKDPAV